MWCYPVWKAQKGEKAELGWWGMELAKRLVESQKIPISIINGAVGGTNYSYDENGNLTNDGTYKYYYDCENRLTDVNNQSDQAVASYKYVYQGRRVKKTVYGSPDVVTKYCYDGDQVIAEYDGSSTLILRKFMYGPGIDEPICMFKYVAPTGIYYYHFDGLGSVVALSNTSGNMVERYSYDVFGEPNRTSSVGNPYMFTGRRYDDESDLYYYRARYYNPNIGRFLQIDPIGYVDGLNLYTYCGNNPVIRTDPKGEGWIDCIKCYFKMQKYKKKCKILVDYDCNDIWDDEDCKDKNEEFIKCKVLMAKLYTNCLNNFRKNLPSCIKCFVKLIVTPPPIKTS